MTQARPLRSIEVAAGLVFRGDRLLIAQRRAGDSLGGYWEFPGGKRHPEETFEDCLRRELREELAIEVTVGDTIETVRHRYAELEVLLKFFRCRWVRHEPQALGCAAYAWVTVAELAEYRFPPADEPLLKRLTCGEEAWG